MWSFVSTGLCISLLSAENSKLKLLHCVVRITGLLLECLCNASAREHFRKLLRDTACLPVEILVCFFLFFFTWLAQKKVSNCHYRGRLQNRVQNSLFTSIWGMKATEGVMVPAYRCVVQFTVLCVSSIDCFVCDMQL